MDLGIHPCLVVTVGVVAVMLALFGKDFLTMYIDDDAATLRRFAEAHPELEWSSVGPMVKGDWDGFRIQYWLLLADGPLDGRDVRDEDKTRVEVYFPADYQAAPTEVPPLPDADAIAPNEAMEPELTLSQEGLQFLMTGTLETVDACEELVDAVVAVMENACRRDDSNDAETDATSQGAEDPPLPPRNLRADPELRECVTEYLENHPRGVLRAVQDRQERRDLEVGWLAGLFGNRPEPPALPLEASKYGGVPYLEDREDWPETDDGEPAPFVGQLNFADIETPEAYPDQGIFGVFRAGPSYHNLFTVRWYPDANLDRAISLDWQEWGRSPEVPIELSTTDSYQIPESWSEILPDAIEARYDRDELSEKLMTVVRGVQRNGGNIAVPMWPALRRWGRHKSDEGYDPGNYVLWHPARAHTGSMAVTLTIDRDDFRKGRLDRCHVVEWQ